MSCPEYYKLADGSEFIDFQADRLIFLMEDEFDPLEIHCILSAAEHLFRKGRKDGIDQHDEKAQIWWTSQARKRYMDRRRREFTGERFPVNKAEKRFDVTVQKVFGNVIAAKEQYLSLMRSIR